MKDAGRKAALTREHRLAGKKAAATRALSKAATKIAGDAPNKA
jgi:hypothetical protein